MRASYNTLRYNAKRRGKAFDLTFEQFKEFCRKTNYINKKGKTASSYSIDRIRPAEGYTVDNIQVLTLAANSLKKYTDYPF
jgi:hypothetical protein